MRLFDQPPKRTFLIHLQGATSLPAERLAAELEQVLELQQVVRGTKIKVYELERDGQ